VGKVYDVDEVVHDPQVLHRRMVVEVEHPGVGKVREVGIAIKLSETPGSVRRAGPYTGEHSDEVLRELGIPPEEIRALREKKVIA